MAMKHKITDKRIKEVLKAIATRITQIPKRSPPRIATRAAAAPLRLRPQLTIFCFRYF